MPVQHEVLNEGVDPGRDKTGRVLFKMSEYVERFEAGARDMTEFAR